MSGPARNDPVDAALLRQIEALRDEVARLGALAPKHRQKLAAVAAERVDAWRKLVLALVPSLEDRALGATSRRLGIPALDPRAVQEELARRRAALEQRVTKARADPALPGAPAQIAELAARRTELEEHATVLRRSVVALAQDPDFVELERRGFGTAEGPGWWTVSHYRLRGRAEDVVARHGERLKAGDLEAVRARHDRERAALATLDEDLRDITQRERALKARLVELERSEAELGSLEERVLEELRAAAERELRGLSIERLLAALADDEPARDAVRAICGVEAKGRYLDALYAHWIERTRLELSSRIQDNEVALVDTSGWARRGPGSTPGEIDADTRARCAEVAQRVRAYESAGDRLLSFRRYADCDPLAGQLWWDAMSGGLIDGSFIDEVAWHRTMRRGAGDLGGEQRAARLDRQNDAALRREAHALDALERARASLASEPPSAAPAAPAPVALPDLDDGEGK